MDLLFNPQTGDEDKLLPIPERLKSYVLPWTSSYYREYPFGYSLVQRFITRKFSVHFWKIHTHEPGTLYPISDKPTIALQAMMDGEISCKLAGFGDKLLENSKYELFYVPASINEALLGTGTYESFHIEIENGFLESIGESYPNVNELLQLWNNASQEGRPMISVTMSYMARSIIRNIRECEKTNGDLVILIHRYIVDLLSEYVTAVRDLEVRNHDIEIAHKEILFAIREYIMAEPNVSNQDLQRLCTKYALNATELKRNFKILFNQTPASFVRFHALTKAHYLISTTTIGIDLIADEVGYGYRANFDKAFKQQFGIQPSKLRK